MKKRQSYPIANSTLMWLFAALLMAVMPHAPRLPLLVTALFLVFLSWRYMMVIYRWQPLSKISRFALTSLGLAVVYITQGTLIGRDAGISLLIAMLGVKLLEMSNERDVYITIMIAYFLVITHFLYSQSLLTAGYMFVVVVVITTTLIDLNRHEHGGAAQIKSNLQAAGWLMLQAAPFMLFLFILFPRIGGPIWGLHDETRGGTTGLSEEMSPGMISNLSGSDEVAFRVKFDAELPPNPQRYWRGPVLWHTDGQRWKASISGQPPAGRSSLPDFEPLGAPFKYTVTMEPSNQRWLFALDLPGVIPQESALTKDFQLQTVKPITQRVRYDMVSFTEYRTGKISLLERQRALQLPAGVNPETQRLGRRWRAELNNEAAIIDAALRMYATEEFIYTLSPPLLLTADPMDKFLFDTRRGFCEHYSSSFVTLMRAAGVPARVVTGYQGGELNPVGDYLIIRQKDAHAWAEVWLDEFGWVRVDPTAAVAPERVELSINNALSRQGEAVTFDLPIGGKLGELVRKFRFGWDSMNNGWNQWVLNYNEAQQRSFLSNLGLGIESWKDMVIALAIALFSLLGMFGAFILLRNYQSPDPIVRLWKAYCRKLSRKGVWRRPSEGPRAFSERVVTMHPEWAGDVNQITQLYIDIRYANAARQESVRALRNAINRFKP